MTVRIALSPAAKRFIAVACLFMLTGTAGLVWWWFRVRPGSFDLVIDPQSVFDGVRWLPARTSIGVRDGKVASLGYLRFARTKRRIKADGLTAAPGFIDVHTHIERNVPSRAPFRADNFARMGVTTIITGNCGASARDIRAFLNGLEFNHSQLNVATLVGHNTVREIVAPSASREASPSETARMARVVSEAMDGGALGLSTGLAYAPGAHAAEREVVHLARATARAGGLYATHIRDEGRDGAAAVDEAIRIGKAAGLPVHLSHMKVACKAQWGQAKDRLKAIEAANREGTRVTLDVYAYMASSTSLDIMLPPHLRGASMPYSKLLNDPKSRASTVAAMLAQLDADGFDDYKFARIAYFHRNRSYERLTIPEVAVRLGVARDAASVPRTVQAETVLRLLSKGGAQMIYFVMDETDMLEFLRHPWCSIGTDSAVRNPEVHSSHPRGVGNHPRILGQYVRDKKALTMEDALRKMTSVAAETFGLKNRGYLRSGSAADIVLFDPEKIADRTTYDDPLAAPSGVAWVFVNGRPVVDPDGPTDNYPGHVIRGPAWGRQLPLEPEETLETGAPRNPPVAEPVSVRPRHPAKAHPKRPGSRRHKS